MVLRPVSCASVDERCKHVNMIQCATVKKVLMASGLTPLINRADYNCNNTNMLTQELLTRV